MRKISFIFICLLIISCVRYSDEFSKDYRKPFESYDTNEIIYFKSNLNDIDTLVIAKIDSTSQRGNGPDVQPNKTIFLEALYPPNNKRFGEILLRNETGEYDSIGNETFISAHKQQINNNSKDDEYILHIGYRDFSGYLDVTKLNDTIKTERGSLRDTLKYDSVIEIYWSKEKGILGYKKKNGELYKKL